MRHTDEYKIWAGIKSRMLNKNCESYKNYVEKCNLTIDPRWINSFECFLEDMGKRPSKQHTVERVDVTKGYWPENCVWLLKSKQALNKTDTFWCEYNDARICLKELCRLLNLKYITVYMRIKRGHADPFFAIPNVKIIGVISSQS